MELAGITFDLIIIRIWRGVTAEQEPTFVKPSDSEREARIDIQQSSIDRSGTATPIVVNLKTITVSDREHWGSS